MLSTQLKDKEVPIGIYGLTQKVPLIVQDGYEKGAVRMFVQRDNFPGDTGIVIATEAMHQELISRGFTMSSEKIRSKLIEAYQVENIYAGLDVKVEGQNIGYPCVNMCSANTSERFDLRN